jgi:hypothetical protein
MLRSSEISLPTLKKLCKISKIKNYSNKKKDEVLLDYNKYLATKIIQRCYRRWFYRDAQDYITMEPVSYPCFVFKTKCGHFSFYNYDSIVKYIMKTGNTRDPLTRLEFSEEDLYRLDQEVKQHYPKNTCYKSTCRIKRSESYARRIRDQENSILSLETRMDEIKTVLINAIQNDYFSWQIGEIVIDNNRYDSINQFIYYTVDELRLLFINLKVYDLDRAIHYNKTIIEELKLVENCSLTNATKIINLVKTY